MATEAYIGINGEASLIKNIYLGVGDISRKVKKAYIGINGLAKLWWKAFDPIYNGLIFTMSDPNNYGFNPSRYTSISKHSTYGFVGGYWNVRSSDSVKLLFIDKNDTTHTIDDAISWIYSGDNYSSAGATSSALMLRWENLCRRVDSNLVLNAVRNGEHVSQRYQLAFPRDTFSIFAFGQYFRRFTPSDEEEYDTYLSVNIVYDNLTVSDIDYSNIVGPSILSIRSYNMSNVVLQSTSYALLSDTYSTYIVRINDNGSGSMVEHRDFFPVNLGSANGMNGWATNETINDVGLVVGAPGRASSGAWSEPYNLYSITSAGALNPVSSIKAIDPAATFTYGYRTMVASNHYFITTAPYRDRKIYVLNENFVHTKTVSIGNDWAWSPGWESYVNMLTIEFNNSIYFYSGYSQTNSMYIYKMSV